jgi:maltose O-acetyltransferase
MKPKKEKMLAGENHLANDKELSAVCVQNPLHRLNVTEYVYNGNAKNVIHVILPNAHKRVYIEPIFHCSDHGYTFIRAKMCILMNCVVLDTMKVTIGNNVLLVLSTLMPLRIRYKYYRKTHSRLF